MELRLKDIIENSEDAVVTLWHVKEDDQVKKDQDLVEVATDKATFDVASPCGGRVRIAKKTGEEFKPDEVIAEIIEKKAEDYDG